jgi:peptidoglycan/LPS O-acetylase OafA/YrhL
MTPFDLKKTAANNDKNDLNIQLARSLAILMVVMQHYKIRMPTSDWYLSIFKYIQLWSGVDIFLAISGFLMCKSLFKEISYNAGWCTTFKRFLLKRFLRLYPVLVVWGLITILISFIAGDRFYTNPLSEFKTLISSLAAVSNFYLHHCVENGYLCSNASGGVTWSLSLEWQLYLALAVLVITFANYKRALVLVFSLICFTSIFIPASEPQNMALAWWVRPIPFFIGAIFYFVNDRKIKLNLLMSLALFTFSFIILITAPLKASTQYVSSTIGLSGGLIFYVFISGFRFKNNFLTKILNWIGDRSYSIYLCHIPVMLAIATLLEFIEHHNNMKFSDFSFLIIYAISMLVSANITYKYVELSGIRFARDLINKSRP